MNTKGVILCGTILTIGVGILYVWLDRRKSTKKIDNKPKEQEIIENEQPEWKPKTPEALLRGLIQEILKENVWKNEREFLSTLSKRYVICAPEVSWLDYLPLNQEDLLECLNELGYLDEYEGELERRYRK